MSSDITLFSVYYVSNFVYNLNCVVVFLPSRSFLQDLTSKKIFFKGYELDGLYYFGDPSASSALSSSLQVFTPPVLEPSVLNHSILNLSLFFIKTLNLWHARLGHANF